MMHDRSAGTNDMVHSRFGPGRRHVGPKVSAENSVWWDAMLHRIVLEARYFLLHRPQVLHEGDSVHNPVAASQTPSPENTTVACATGALPHPGSWIGNRSEVRGTVHVVFRVQ